MATTPNGPESGEPEITPATGPTPEAEPTPTTEPTPESGHGKLAETLELPPVANNNVTEPIEPLPVTNASTNSASTTSPTGNAASIAEPTAAPEPPKKKHRLRNWLIALGIVAVLVVIAWIVGDIIARDYAKSFIRETVTTSFELEPDAPMDIEIGPGSLIAQAIGGSIDSVDVSIPDMPLGDLTGDLTLALTGIPLTAEAPVDTLRVGVSIDEAEVGKLASYLSDADLTTIELENNEIVLATKFSLFGTDIPLSLSIVPSAVDGAISFAPRTFTVNDAEISLDDVRDGPLGGIASGLLDSGTFCVDEYLPKAITLTDVAVTDTTLELSAEGDGTPLGSADLSTFGTCE